MIRAHVDAVLTLLAPLSAAPSSTPVFDGTVDDESHPVPTTAPPRTPYVVVSSDDMPMRGQTLGTWSSTLDGLLYVRCVGSDRREAQWAQEKTRALLLDVRPQVTGRSCWPLKLVDGDPLRPDRDVTPPVLVVVDVYRLASTPAAQA